MRISNLFTDPETRDRVHRAELDAVNRVSTLTKQQLEVLTQMIEGHPNKVIAHRMNISQRTVENHRAAVMDRLRIRSLIEATRLVILAG